VKINFAHVRIQGQSVAIFDADARTHTKSARTKLLTNLVSRVRLAGLRVDKAALAFIEAGDLTFFGSPDLVRYLVKNGLPEWTHTIDV
jgi:hypothetical protein